MAEIAAIFDVEGTLFTSCRVLWWGVLTSQAKKRHKILQIVCHIVSQTALGVLHKLGVVSPYRVRMKYSVDVARLLAGVRSQDTVHLADELAQKLLPYLRPDIEHALREHRQRGHRIVIVSAVLQPFLEAVGSTLGASLCVGTGLEEKEGYFTGRLSTPVCFGEQRARMLIERLSNAGLEVDLASSYAYGDTIWDAPVLEMVGTAVATYPDAKLRSYAKRHGWRIVGPRATLSQNEKAVP